MAVYCSTTFAKSFNPQRVYNTSSKPTLAQLSSIITVVSAKINGAMAGAGITVPITTSPATQASLYLKYICGLGSAGEAEEAAFMGGNKNVSEHSNSLLTRFQSELDKISKNPAIITGLSGNYRVTADSLEYSNSDLRREDGDWPFTRDTKNW